MKKGLALLVSISIIVVTLSSCDTYYLSNPPIDEPHASSEDSYIEGEGLQDDSASSNGRKPSNLGNMRYAKKQLSGTMQEYYDLFDRYIYGLEEEIHDIPLEVKDFDKLLEHYRSDNPQAFWLPYTYRYHYDQQTGEIVTVKFEYLYEKKNGDTVIYTKEKVKSMSAELEAAAAELFLQMEQDLGKSVAELPDYDIILYLHDYLAKNVRYDSTSAFQHNAYGALVKKQAVCDGYSTAMQYLLTKIGITCYTIYGDDRNDDPPTHAWNLVQIGENYYHLDVTWDLPAEDLTTPTYANFLVDEGQILKKHIIFSPLEGEDPGSFGCYPTIPRSNQKDQWYYIKNDTYVTDLSDDSIRSALHSINQSIAMEEEWVQLYFEKRSDLLEFASEIKTRSGRFDKLFPYNLSGKAIYYYVFDNENIMMLKFE